ncbi:MAG: hypothetical protein JEZ14_07825 [Marinilabiliaceae bacterium]|nr:hypothetical protein [Marinilabiliaceae bacterium]
MDLQNKIEKLLPNYNCGSCGFNSCKAFATHIIKNNTDIENCPLLNQYQYTDNKKCLKQLVKTQSKTEDCSACISGLLDSYEADIVLLPLPNEHSCKEVLLPMSDIFVKTGNIIEYRPLGCPVVHYARVLAKNGTLITVHVVGPSFKKKSVDVGLCMVIGFEGTYTGKQVKVGETVRFLPQNCMMQKIHSGVVINIEDNKIKLEGIDLKVWAPPVKVN